MDLKVVITKDSEHRGSFVRCPALPGSHTRGETLGESLKDPRDTIEGSRSHPVRADPECHHR